MLHDIEASKDEPGEVEKRFNGKQIKVNKVLVAWTLRGSLQWTRNGQSRYSQEERDLVTAFAEQ